MTNRKITASEYKIVADCMLAMWMDNRLRDSEYYSFMNRLNEFAKGGACGIWGDMRELFKPQERRDKE